MKQKIFSTICVLFLFFLACSFNSHLRTTDEMTDYNTQLIQEVNRLGKKKKARVSLKNGRTIFAQNISVSQDSTTFTVVQTLENRNFDVDINWYTQNQGKSLGFANKEIVYIRFDSAELGAVQGLALGTITGVVLGNMFGRYQYAHLPYDEDPASERVFRAIFSVGGGAIGGVFGLIYGSSAKSKHYYYFLPPQHQGNFSSDDKNSSK